MGSGVFSRCHSLKDVQILAPLTSIPPSTFAETAIESITLPETVTSIEEYAFYNTYLKSITLPASVEYIGNRAFGRFWYNYLKEVISLNPEPPAYVHEDAFFDITRSTLWVPKGSRSSYAGTRPWNLFMYIFELDDDTQGIADAPADAEHDAPVDIYNMQGVRVRTAVSPGDTRGLPQGIYLVGGKKIRVD